MHYKYTDKIKTLIAEKRLIVTEEGDFIVDGEKKAIQHRVRRGQTTSLIRIVISKDEIIFPNHYYIAWLFWFPDHPPPEKNTKLTLAEGMTLSRESLRWVPVKFSTVPWNKGLKPLSVEVAATIRREYRNRGIAHCTLDSLSKKYKVNKLLVFQIIKGGDSEWFKQIDALEPPLRDEEKAAYTKRAPSTHRTKRTVTRKPSVPKIVTTPVSEPDKMVPDLVVSEQPTEDTSNVVEVLRVDNTPPVKHKLSAYEEFCLEYGKFKKAERRIDRIIKGC